MEIMSQRDPVRLRDRRHMQMRWGRAPGRRLKPADYKQWDPQTSFLDLLPPRLFFQAYVPLGRRSEAASLKTKHLHILTFEGSGVGKH